MSDVAFLYNTPHPAHRVFAEAVGADFHPLVPDDETAGGGWRRLTQYVRGALTYPSGYDYYLVEGGRGLVPGFLYSLRNRDATVLLLNADETFLNLELGLEHYRAAETLAHRVSLRAVDGVLNVGEMVATYARRAGVTVPSEIVYPPVADGVYEDLLAAEPAIGSQRIVSVGENKPAVGFDVLVDAVARLRADGSQVELHLAGENHEAAWGERDGVTVHGWVEDLSSFLASGDLSVHPGRSECFPVSTLEPMVAGCPCIVSEYVGTKEVIRPIDDYLVIEEPRVEETAKAIHWYFERPRAERERLSREARAAARQFSEAECAAGFVDAYERLTARV